MIIYFFKNVRRQIWKAINWVVDSKIFLALYFPFLLFILIFPKLRPYLSLAIIKKKIVDRVDSFNSHSSKWNQIQLKQIKKKVTAVKKLYSQYRENIMLKNDFFLEKELLVKEVVIELKNDADWIYIDDLEQLKNACIETLTNIREELQFRSIALSMEGLRQITNGYIELYDEQIISSLIVDKYFLELRNGEGKTYVAIPTLAWAAIKMQALKVFCKEMEVTVPFDKVLYFTSNDYLVRRDFIRLKSVYELLGISISYIQKSVFNSSIRRLRYSADIVMIEGTDFGFDYLKNSSRNFKEPEIKCDPYFILVDEVDQLLIDEARTPLILSGNSSEQLSNFIEKAWVKQVNEWIRTIYLENSIFKTVSTNSFCLNQAGRLYFRSILRESQVESWYKCTSLLKKKDIIGFVEALLLIIINNSLLQKQINNSTTQKLQQYLEKSPTQLIFQKLNGEYGINFKKLMTLQIEGSLQKNSLIKITKELFKSMKLNTLKHTKEDYEYIRKSRRRALTMMTKIFTNNKYLVGLFELLINEIAIGISKTNMSKNFIDGLIRICNNKLSSDQMLNTNFINWTVKEGIQGILNVIIPVINKYSSDHTNFENTTEKDLALIFHAIKIFNKSNIDFEDSKILKKAIGNSILLGNVLGSSLFLPRTGVLTSAGIQIAYYLEELCMDTGLTENYTKGGIVELIQTALTSYFSYEEDAQYSIRDKNILLINQVNGRPQPSKSFGRFLHPFIQAKHGLKIEEPNATLRTITIQSLMSNVPHVTGMSGTILSEEIELRKLYPRHQDKNHPVVVQVPPRIDPIDLGLLKYSTLNLTLTINNKINSIVKFIENERFNKKNLQPLLVITSSVKYSKAIAENLQKVMDSKEQLFKVNVLNALSIEKEEEIISFAGHPGAITIATQMAARGTDIIIPKDSIALGGLFVVISEFHENERLDTQAEGRAARHGDVGEVKYFMSLEDGFSKNYPSWYKKFMANFLKDNNSESIEIPIDNVKNGIEDSRAYLKRNQSRMIEFQTSLDRVIDEYRKTAYNLREYFISGKTSKIIQGLKVSHEIGNNYLNLYSQISTINDVVELILIEIKKAVYDPENLFLLLSEKLNFPIEKKKLSIVLDTYAKQQTPMLKMPNQKYNRHIKSILTDLIIESASLEDRRIIDNNWKLWDKEYGLSDLFSPNSLTKLLLHLNDILHLGFNTLLVNNTFDAVAEKLKSKKQVNNFGELIRKAIIESLNIIESKNYYNHHRNLHQELKSDNLQKVFSKTSLSKLINHIEKYPNCDTIGKQILELFDSMWEKVNDEINITSNNIRRKKDWDKEWVTIIQQFHEQLSHKLMIISGKILKQTTNMAHLSEAIDKHETLNKKRFFDSGTFGSHWFMNVEQLYEDNKVEEPESYINYVKELKTSDLSEVSKNFRKTQTKVLDNFNGKIRTALIQQKFHLSDSFKREFFLSQNYDFEKLVFEHSFDLDTDDTTWLSNYHLTYKGDGLSAISFLNKSVVESGQIAVQKAKVFQEFGCKKSELKYLYQVYESGNLSTKLRLRFTHLLSGLSENEKQFAISLILKSGVPDIHRPFEKNLDLHPYLAFSNALKQLSNYKAYDQVIDLYLNNIYVLILSFQHNFVNDYLLIADAFWKSTLEKQDSFYTKTGLRWKEWIDNLFNHLLYEYNKIEEEKQPKYFSDYFKVLLSLSLISKNKVNAEFIIKKVMNNSKSSQNWLFIANHLEAYDFYFESKMCKIRYLLLEELYEESYELSQKTMNEYSEQEVYILGIYSLINLIKCIKHDLYGRHLVIKEYIPNFFKYLSNIDEEQQNLDFVIEYNASCLCLINQYKDAQRIIQNSPLTKSRWRIKAFLEPELQNISNFNQVSGLLNSVNMSSTSETLEGLILCNEWLESQNNNLNNDWLQEDSILFIDKLYSNFEKNLENKFHYKVFWELGKTLRIKGELLLNMKKTSQALSIFSDVTDKWKLALKYTYSSENPNQTILKRHEELVREKIEEDLRRNLQVIKKNKSDVEINS